MPARSPKPKPVRQNLTVPAALAVEAHRVTKAEPGVRDELEARENLKTAYRRFMKEQEPARKKDAGRDLIRAIFGKDAVSEDSLR
jgi:hypothetical protein